MSTGAGRPRILIVEDEPVIAADLQASLEGLGYHVVGVADTGRKALRLVDHSSPDATLPDVVLMDITLKGEMDGITAADEIRRRWSIPIVFLSANASEETAVHASATGAYGYLLKPIRIKELNATILVALQQHRLARELFSEQTWLRTMLQSLNDGVIATDAEGRLRYVNPAGEALLGQSLPDVAGKPIEDVFRLSTLRDEPIKVCHLRQALISRSAVGKGRFLMHSHTGRVVPIEDAAAPILLGDCVIGAVNVFVDISERLRREREAELERERLEEKVQLTAEALGNTRAELRALSGHLIMAQEEERRRVARELHDDLGQRAAIAEMELERMIALLPPQNEAAHATILNVKQRLGELSTRLRDVSHDLHPSVVEDLGLAVALRSLVDDYREQGAEASFTTIGDPPVLPREIGTPLYRIAQEALRNAAKHAGGAPIRVALENREKDVHLRIEDAGPGFDLTLVRGNGGLGLLSMQERARLAGGSLLLRTHPGTGTLIVVRVPI